MPKPLIANIDRIDTYALFQRLLGLRMEALNSSLPTIRAVAAGMLEEILTEFRARIAASKEG